MQEGFVDPPSHSSINRLLRGGRPGDDGKKDYTIDGILGGGKSDLIISSILQIQSDNRSKVLGTCDETFTLHNFTTFLWFKTQSPLFSLNEKDLGS